MLLRFERAKETPPFAGQVVWNACRRLAGSAVRLAACLCRLVELLPAGQRVHGDDVAQRMRRACAPLEVAVVVHGPRGTAAGRARTGKTSAQEKAGLPQRAMGRLARVEGEAADKDFAVELARLVRQIVSWRLRGAGGAPVLPAPDVRRMALAMLRPMQA